MILKVYTPDRKGWCLHDHLSNVAIRHECVKKSDAPNIQTAADRVQFAASQTFVYTEDIQTDGDSWTLRTIYADSENGSVQIVFNTQAYLMTDDGKTIESFQAE
jgi:hypothetical protein